MKRSFNASKAGVTPSKPRATGTAGDQGQLFTVYERNWQCESCDQENYPLRNRCTRCKKKRPEGSGRDYVEDPALLALKAGIVNPWREAIDPATKQMYYYNDETRATQWERPIEMGEAPLATGWFGRGQAGSTAAKEYLELNSKYLSAPARKQKDQIDPKSYHTEGQNEYNIWYDRYVGDTKDKSSLREPAEDRCKVDKDAGYTKADKGGLKRKETRHFCLHFARGICAKGADCMYYHRIPLPADDANCDEMSDCFGRQRHSSHRQDMNGVGSFMNPSRTLFVGNLTRSKYESPKALEDAVWKHFSEWGELENVNVVHRLSIAFPRYRLRTSAEFAKEAMTCQTLDWKEVLSIRWAHDDPNPIAQNSISMADKDALSAFLDARGVSTEVSNFNGPLDYHVPDPKRSKLIGPDCLDEYPELAYPDTDRQYATTHPTSLPGRQEPGPGMYSQDADAGVSRHSDSFTDRTHTVKAAAVQGGSGPFCVGDYTAFFSALSAPQGSSISSSAHSGHMIANGSQSQVEDLLDKKRLLMSLGLGSYIEDSAVETAVVPPKLAAIQIAVAAGDEQLHLAETCRAEEEVEDGDDNDDDNDDDDDELDEGVDGWTTHVDPGTGATYYHNRSTGESSWGSAPVP